MKGSNVAGVNPLKLGGAGKGTNVAGTHFKMPGAMKPKVPSNQNIKLKGIKPAKLPTVSNVRSNIHQSRGGSVMKKLLGV